MNVTFTHSEMLDIRNAIGYRLHVLSEYLRGYDRHATLYRMYTAEHEALSKLKDALDTCKDVILNISPSPVPASTPRDQVLDYLYKRYDRTIVGAYIYVFSKDSGTWAYFIRQDDTLHTDLLDEDFTYYRDNMYPDEEYDV